MELKNIEIASHAKRINKLAEQAIPDLAKEASSIIQSRSINKQEIENCLDRLLGFAFHPEALGLFKQLCRYYLTVDSVATRQYVRFYKEMYENT